MEHGIHPNLAHHGLAWIVVAATFAEVMRPQDTALEMHVLTRIKLYGYPV